MGMFSSKSQPQAAARSPGAPPKGAPAGGGLSIIAPGMTVRGDLESDGIVKVEGAVDGHVLARQQVLVARGGIVRGDIDTREAVIGGTVEGSVHAAERVEVQAGATVAGDITTRRIAVAEGATLNGQIRMGDITGGATRTAGAALDVRVSPGRAEGRPSAVPTRPSVPVARVAVPPRSSTAGNG
jgi:cytoskeletal protein CcmA (bactofilin family)